MVLLKPLEVEVRLCENYGVRLGPGVFLVFGLELDEGYLGVPPLLDGDFLEYLLFDLPKTLDRGRRPVLVEDIVERFTRNVDEGVVYALDILFRVSRVYRIPVVVFEGRDISGRYSFSRALGCARGEDGRTYCSVNGEVVCVR